MAQPVLPSTCPDCGGTLHLIQMIGRGKESPLSGEAEDVLVRYYSELGAAPLSTWAHMIQEKGQVRTCMCQSCHRIFLYGVPHGEGSTHHVKIAKSLVEEGEAKE